MLCLLVRRMFQDEADPEKKQRPYLYSTKPKYSLPADEFFAFSTVFSTNISYRFYGIDFYALIHYNGKQFLPKEREIK